MGRTRFLSLRVAELLAVAVVGGGLALGGAAALGKLGDHTTVQQVSPTTQATTSTVQPAKAQRGLTPEQIYNQDGPGVVQITATTITQAPADPFNFLPSTPQTSQSLGSGFVIDRAGHIVTNFHVIQNAEKVQVSFSGQDQLPAEVVGKDRSTDLAVLKIDAHARALTPLPLGNSDGVRVGDPVYAIGNPFGLTRTLTTGVVSAVQRQIFAPNGVPIDSAIQTDAAINHGNSGGPLIDAGGRVIGVTSQIQTGSAQNQGNVGIGFAIPVNTVRDIAGQIIAHGQAQHAFLGLSADAITPQLKKLFNLPTAEGLLVRNVEKGSGAAKAGIRGGTTQVVVEGETYLVGGDIITKIDGQAVGDVDQLFAAVQKKNPGDTMKIELWHDGSQKTVTAKLGTRQNP
ncbi:MAG TPA: trypsin-like peptidase domain-containing protein [Gaiellaceae bacterium]|nr:trypsin-like peptidase domain-containing protein [Gaiellaceae bacterium]